MRLIDADALDLDREVEMADDWNTAHEIANCVKYAPTIDAVQVVRCKECTYYSCHQKGKPWKVARPYCNRSVTMATEPDDYCSRGERQEAQQ